MVSANQIVLTFVVRVTAGHEDGPFASRDDLTAAVRDELDAANPGSLEGAEDGTYGVTAWDVQAVDTLPGERSRPVHLSLSVAEARALLEHAEWGLFAAASRALVRVKDALEQIEAVGK